MKKPDQTLKSIEWMDGSFQFIDQTKLPQEVTFIRASDYRIVVEAIKKLRIRGAPAIGIAAAYAAALAAQESAGRGGKSDDSYIENALRDIESARPTARNLFFALERMRNILNNGITSRPEKLTEAFLAEANRLYEEDVSLCRRIGMYGADLIKDGATIITHCNTGKLVSAGIGTALGIVLTAVRQNKKIHLYVDETRPLLQGARLTTWECLQSGIPCTLICDSAAADLLGKGKIDSTIVGADRIAANGDVANKIGTYSLAVLCESHKVPFYVAAPYTTFDLSLKSGKDIPIEERSPHEVTTLRGGAIAPENIRVFNPAFDVTPARYVSAIITDAGVFRPPYGEWSGLKKVE